MTAPPKVVPWWTRPALVLPAVAALAFAAALFTPLKTSARSGDARLSTLSTEPLGASLAFSLAERLGWTVDRRLRPGIPEGNETVIAVLDPAIPLRLPETHALLEHVRGGGGAYVVLGGSTASLMDSLHIAIGTGGRAHRVEADSRECRDRTPRELASALWFGDPQMLTLRWTAPLRSATMWTFLTAGVSDAKDGSVARATVVGFDYGKGRMVVSVDPDVLRNDAMRDCGPGLDIAYVRALEFLREGGEVPRTRIVFDEYHQAHGAHPGTMRAAALYLRDSPSGRLLAQLAVAGLLLMLALAPRTVPPRAEARLERRSPLEQVDALARAYEQVAATRTAAERLVRGVRRRAERRRGRDRSSSSDDAWLARVGERVPSLAEEVAIARSALGEKLSPRSFAALGPALHKIEATLTDS